MFGDLADCDEPQFISPIPLSTMIEWLEAQGFKVCKPEEYARERTHARCVEMERDQLRLKLDLAAELYTNGHESCDILGALLTEVQKIYRA